MPTADNPIYDSGSTIDRLGDTAEVTNIKWIDSTRYLFLRGSDLRFSALTPSSMLLDTGVSDYSFAVLIY